MSCGNLLTQRWRDCWRCVRWCGFDDESVIALACAFMGPRGFAQRHRASSSPAGRASRTIPTRSPRRKQLLSIDDDKDLLKKHYVLVNTIDLADTPVYGFIFFGFFRGSFDGNGYAIHNLGTEAIHAKGLFMHIWPGAEVKNVGIVNAYVESSGVLADVNQGTVQNCYCTGAVVRDSGGGLIDLNYYGTVADCYSEAEVSGPNSVGGLIGGSSGLVSRCHSSGKVVGDFNNVGGLIGAANGEVSSCYSTSEVSGLNHVGGLIGYSQLRCLRLLFDRCRDGQRRRRRRADRIQSRRDLALLFHLAREGHKVRGRSGGHQRRPHPGHQARVRSPPATPTPTS